MKPVPVQRQYSDKIQSLYARVSALCCARYYAMIVMSVLAFGIFALGIQKESIWHDEWCTVNVIEQPTFSEFIQEMIRTENNPPLYYLLLRAWTLNGTHTSPRHIRLLSALFAAITVGLTFYLASLITTHSVGWIAALFTATSPYMCWYAQETRNLTLSACMTLLCIIAFYRFCQKPQAAMRYAWAVSCMILGIFSHYFIAFLVPAQLLFCWYFTDKKTFAKWVAGIAVVCVLFALWIPSLHGQLDDFHTEWLGKPSVLFLWNMLRFFTGGLYYSAYPMLSLTAAIISAGFFLYGAIGSLTKKTVSKNGVFLLIFFIIPLILPILISYIKPILFQGRRYLIYILPIFFLITALGISLFGRKRYAIAAVIIIIASNIYGLHQMVQFKQKRQWKTAARAISAFALPGDALFSTDYTNGSILTYYGIGSATLCVIPDMSIYEPALAPYRRLWFVTYIPRCPYQTFFDRKYQKIQEKTFRSDGGFIVRLTLYDLGSP